MPRFSVTYSFDEGRNLYVSVAKGYKAGGFNTQLFSDILQEKLKARMLSGVDTVDPARMSYKPEYGWSYEAGGHFSCCEGIVRGDSAPSSTAGATSSSPSSPTAAPPAA